MTAFENLEVQAHQLKYWTEQTRAMQSEFVSLLEHGVAEKHISELQRKQLLGILMKQPRSQAAA